MITVIGVKFKNSGKAYYFDPKDEIFSEGDGVILNTARGVEYGTVSIANKEVSEKEITPPLKEIIRKATEDDAKRYEENLARRENLMKTAMEKTSAHGLNMKIVDAEYTFDRSKIIIYFTAESRVDFRDLVRELAGTFHTRIELRQIYERDDIKMRGALAACGRPCCCSVHLPGYEKVSIKMAKIQGLSLNPQKISGCCGKLMCCLKYENAFYQDMFKKMPKLKSPARTPDGEGIVIGHDMLREEVKVKFIHNDGSNEIKTYPLSAISAKFKQNVEEVTDDVDE